MKRVFSTIETGVESPVEKLTFNVDNYAVLVILHENGELSRAILKKNED
jgi:hypothetical protein